jgi:hypothetical protein
MAHNVLRLSAVRIFEILVLNSDSGYCCPYSRKPFVSRSCRVIIKHMAKKKDKWIKVVFASDCIYQDWDEDRECPECPQCGKDYADCPCPGQLWKMNMITKKWTVFYTQKRKHESISRLRRKPSGLFSI